MRIALLGAMGFVGQTTARELALRPEVRDLLLVDYRIREAKRFAKTLSPKCRSAMADVGRGPELERLLDGVDAVASAVGPCAEYEKGILLACASAKTPAASIGDGVLSGSDLREIRDAFLRAGTGAVTGCGMMPGWTDLLAAHCLPSSPGGGAPSAAEEGTSCEDRGESEAPGAPERGRFLLFSPDRFGGYAFFRRVSRELSRPVTAPSSAPRGRYFEAAGRTVLGLPEGRAAGLCGGIGGGKSVFGAVGQELQAAFLYWLRRFMRTGPADPAAAAGAIGRGGPPGTSAWAVDPGGRLAGALLAETVLLLAREREKRKGLLPLPALVGREEAFRIAASAGGEIRVG